LFDSPRHRLASPAGKEVELYLVIRRIPA
jgi:hypothetical protein